MAKSDGISAGISCGDETMWAMPRFNLLRLASTRFTSQVNNDQWINLGFMFTSHGEDVHLRVEPLATPNSRGPNES